MLIRVTRPWHLPLSAATPETFCSRRREFLQATGLLAALPAISAAAARNPRYMADRPLTVEWAASAYNNYYEVTTDKGRVKDLMGAYKPRPWTLEVTGLVNKPLKFSIEDLERTMPVEERVYRHRCVEAWAMTVPWLGFPLAHLLKMADPMPGARFVRFISVNRPEEMPGIKYSGNYEWPYREALRIDEAMNELAFLVTGLFGKPLPKQNGAPIRLATPWKYGFKSAKAIVEIQLVEKQPTTFWNQAYPSDYGFYSNVNPDKPHPRWSQAVEQLIPNMERVATRKYNGYGEFVAHLYNGAEI